MHSYTDRIEPNKSRAVANGVAQAQREDKSVVTFVDNRPTVLEQKRLQELAGNSPNIQRRGVFQKKGHSPESEIATPIIQCNFPDPYNDSRKDSQKSGLGSNLLIKNAVKLDHMVSQKNLKSFADVYKILNSLTSHQKSKWEKTKDAMEKLREAVPRPTAKQEFFSKGHLINIPNNIVPGLDNEIQGAGDNFDPQVANTGQDANSKRVEQTALSRSQFKMDSAIRIINHLVGSAGEALPKGQAASNKMQYNSDLDEDIARQINTVTDAMKAMAKVDEPIHNPNMWYSHAGSNVKKRSADWIEDETQVQIGGAVAPAQANWNHQFTFDAMTIANETGRVQKLPVTVNVNLQVPVATWAHIYDRHYLPTFGGTVEAVNTFWKTDPYAYLTNAPGIDLLETELQLILERSFNFYKAYSSVEYDTENISWSEGADKFFFQGNAESEAVGIDATDGIEYDVRVLLKSIAPQDADLAFALRPDQL